MYSKSFLIYLLVLFLVIPAFGIKDSKDSLLQVLRTTDIPSEKITILNKLSKAYAADDALRSENYASQALFISESIEDVRGKSEAYYNLGLLAYNKKQYDIATDYLINAEEGFNALKDEKWLAKVYLLLSDEYKRNLEYEKAINSLYRAMETFKKLDKRKKLAETYNAIGGIYYDQDNYEKAFEFYENSLDLYKELKDMRGMGALLNNIGEIYRIKNEYAKAIDYYNKSLNIFLELNDPVILATIYTNLGNIYLDKENLDSSEHYLSQGLELSNLTKDLDRMSSVRISFGKLFRARGDLEKAHENLNIGYDLAVQNSNLSNIIIASQVLSELHYQKNDFPKAYKYFKRYRNNEDSLHNKSHLEKITQMEMTLLFDLENEIQQIQIQRNKLKHFTVAIVLVSLIIIVILLYGRQRIKIRQSKTQAENLHIESEQLQDEIDYKDRELATNVMYLVKKNELINYISEKLLKAKQKFKPSIIKSIDEILIDLQSNVDKDIWQAFADRFKAVHKGFYKNLMEQFPNLSENEKKLCAFIRLDMNTKEIATILLQNPNSIEVARTRLRKKLNISNTDISLNSFLSKI